MERLAFVDGLRGLAICAVIYHHVFGAFTPPGFHFVDFYGLPLLPFAPLANGWLAVNLFFILSGLVLYAPYASNERSVESWADVLDFLRRRARRLLPLYYLVSLVSFVFFLGPEQRSLDQFIHLIAATFNFTKATYFPAYNLVLWSLGLEIWFSLVFPALVLLSSRFGISRVFAATACSSLAVRLWGHGHGAYYESNPVLNFVKDSFAGRLDDFVLGMLLAALFEAMRSGLLPRLARNLDAYRIPSILLGVALCHTTAACWDGMRLGWLTSALVPVTNNIFQLGCLFLIAPLLTSNLRGSSSPLLLGFVPIRLLGMMSYSLYVWHAPAIVQIIGSKYTPERIATYFALIFMVSILSYRYVEFGHVRSWQSVFGSLRTR
jgi:peptidoglycan/LPS O-acetylase OafA/YrhL